MWVCSPICLGSGGKYFSERTVIRLKHFNIRMAESPDECNVITHDGIFHADDVFAVAMLLTLEPLVVYRTRDMSIISEKSGNPGVTIVDVGGQYDPSRGLYDHHLPDWNRTGERGNLLASAGLIWDDYAEVILTRIYDCPDDYVSEVKSRVYRTIIRGVDAQDYGRVPKSIMTVSGIISLYNTRWDEDPKIQNGQFIAAVQEARKFLKRVIHHSISIESGKRLVENYVSSIEDDSAEILVLPQFIGAWQSTIINMESDKAKRLKYVVFKDRDAEQYSVQGVPLVDYADVNETGQPQRQVRVPFPEEWRGVSNSRFPKMTGVETAMFCHKEGYLAVAATEEGAIKLAELSLEMARSRKNLDYVQEQERIQENEASDDDSVEEEVNGYDITTAV